MRWPGRVHALLSGLRRYCLWDALVVISSIWSFQLRSFLIVTPKDSIWWDPIETHSIQDYRGEIPRRLFEAYMELLALRGVNLKERFSRDQLLIWFTANRTWLYCDGRILQKLGYLPCIWLGSLFSFSKQVNHSVNSSRSNPNPIKLGHESIMVH